MNKMQKSQFLIYQSEDGKIKLDVRFENETVWLTQVMIAELFQSSVPNISMHIKSVYEEEELKQEATLKKFLTVRQEGARSVQRELEYDLFNQARIAAESKQPNDFDKFVAKVPAVRKRTQSKKSGEI